MDAKVKKLRVGDLLISKQLISKSQLEQALFEQKNTGKKLGKAITDLGFVTETELLTALSDYFGYPYVDLTRFRLDVDLVHRLPEAQSRRYRALLLSEDKDGIMVGMVDPTDLMVIDDLQRVLKRPILPAFIQETALLSILDNIYRRQEQMESIAGELAGSLHGCAVRLSWTRIRDRPIDYGCPRNIGDVGAFRLLALHSPATQFSL